MTASLGLRRRWSPEQNEKLLSLYERGVSIGAIALLLARTEESLWVRLSRLRRRGAGDGALTPAEVAAILGVTPSPVKKWCADGVIPATKRGKNRWFVTRDAFEAWLQSPMSAAYVFPIGMAPGFWRDVATEAQREHGYVSVKTAAHLVGVTTCTMYKRVGRGVYATARAGRPAHGKPVSVKVTTGDAA